MSESYYVKATGNDANNGLTDTAPFQTLAKAVDMAKRGDIKTITVIGTLDAASEANASETLPKDPVEVRQNPFGTYGKSGSIFYIKDTGKDEILITGKEDAILQGVAENEMRLLIDSLISNSSSLDKWRTERNMRVLHVSGISNIRLENIVITAGAVHGFERSRVPMFTSPPSVSGPCFYPPDGHGGGILVSDGATITLGDDAVVCKNIAIGGGGIAVTKGTLEISGGIVTENKAIRGGGIYSGRTFLSENSTTINLQGGSISKNIVFGKRKTAQRTRYIYLLIHEQPTGLGGGVYIDRNSIFNMSSGIIEKNVTQQAKKEKIYTYEVYKKTGLQGGGVYVDGGTFKMSKGIVANNKAQKGNDLCYTKGSAIGQGKYSTIRNKAKV